MIKVKYWDNIDPKEFNVEFDTEAEAAEWIEYEMNSWWEILNDKYPNADVTWLNRLLDCGNTTEIYIPNSFVTISCTLERR